MGEGTCLHQREVDLWWSCCTLLEGCQVFLPPGDFVSASDMIATGSDK